MTLDTAVNERIASLVQSNRVVLFMKGNRQFPQCGFSATVVQMLNEFLPTYQTVNVLTEPAIRDGIKDFSSWPTIPQLYIDGEFVGGCDIVKELYASGELSELLVRVLEPTDAAVTASVAPAMTLTDGAAHALHQALAQEKDAFVRLEISAEFSYDLSVGPREPTDIEVSANGLVLLLDPTSAKRAAGTVIDFVPGDQGGFKITNSNETPRVKPMNPAELKALLAGGGPVHLFDVRTERERATAKIEGSYLFDEAGQAAVRELPKDATIVFHCHHGGRSQAAAERYAAVGYRNVFNLVGGIDAWSQSVDSTVPRY